MTRDPIISLLNIQWMRIRVPHIYRTPMTIVPMAMTMVEAVLILIVAMIFYGTRCGSAIMQCMTHYMVAAGYHLSNVTDTL